jgi:hypothetical protein
MNIRIDLKNTITPEIWERIEDEIAEALSKFNLQGEIANSVTGNSIQFGEQKDDNIRRCFNKTQTR